MIGKALSRILTIPYYLLLFFVTSGDSDELYPDFGEEMFLVLSLDRMSDLWRIWNEHRGEASPYTRPWRHMQIHCT
jgi:hypothetical protein